MTTPGFFAEASLYQTKHHDYGGIAGLQPYQQVTPQIWAECKAECGNHCNDYYNECLTGCGTLPEGQQGKCEYRCDSQYDRCGQYCSDACTQGAIAEMIDDWESEHPGGKPWWENPRIVGLPFIS